MKSASIRWLTLALILAAALCRSTSATAPTQTTRIVAAANTFLATLTDKQRGAVLFAFDDAQQRARWSNFPTGFIPRAGISLKEMNPAQRTAAMALVAATLSPRGLQKVEQIIEGDEVNKALEAKNAASGRGNGPPGGFGGPPRGADGGLPPGADSGPPPGARNGPPPGGAGNRPPFRGLSADLFGKDLYFFSILGTPSEKTPWMLQFGGHHLALNITIAGGRGVLTPTLTGAQPALYTLDGKTVRPLGPESDKALALFTSLDEPERKQAVIGARMADLVLGPGQDGKTIQPEGLKASAMTSQQRALLLDVIAEWAGIIHQSAAATRMAELKADLDQTWFAWSGPTTGTPGKNITAYYRIQGPHLVIEYSPQGLGGDPSLHVHTMYRDPTDDYGRRLIQQ